MRTWAAACLLLAAPACSPKSNDAEVQYKIVSDRGTVAEKCQKAREVEQAYLAAHDPQGYSRWKKVADADCSDVTLDTAQLPANQAEQIEALNAMANEAAEDAARAQRK